MVYCFVSNNACLKEIDMTDVEFLKWIEERLIHVYKESPNVDFIHRLRSIIDNMGLVGDASGVREALLEAREYAPRRDGIVERIDAALSALSASPAAPRGVDAARVRPPGEPRRGREACPRDRQDSDARRVAARRPVRASGGDGR